MNLITSKLAALSSISKVQTLALADKHADTMDSKTEKVWKQILQIIYARPFPSDGQNRLSYLFALINQELYSGVQNALYGAVKLNRANAAADMVDVLPIEYINLALTSKTDVMRRLRISEGRKATRAERSRIESMLLPIDDEETIRGIVFAPSRGTSWTARMAAQTSLASPQQLANTITMGALAGEDPKQLARRILPVVQNVRTSARRIARTESIRMSTESTLQMYEGMGDLIIGYQIHALLDWRTRPHHAARHGTIYYRDPAPNQPSMRDMPRPPIDEDGSVAYNCRCSLSAVFRPSQRVENDPALKALFTDRAGEYIPDPRTYEQWFARASQKERQWAVGTRRLQAAQSKLQPGEQLRWANVIDPKTGSLLSDKQIRTETLAKRQNRIDKVDQVIDQRHQLYKAVTTFGYVPPLPPSGPIQPTIPTPVPQVPPTIGAGRKRTRVRKRAKRSRRA